KLFYKIHVSDTASKSCCSISPATPTATPFPYTTLFPYTAPPTISGTAQQGQTLTESPGTWTNNPTGFSYQWQRCDAEGNNCTPNTGTTHLTNVLTAEDVRQTIRVSEIASNAGASISPAT